LYFICRYVLMTCAELTATIVGRALWPTPCFGRWILIPGFGKLCELGGLGTFISPKSRAPSSLSGAKPHLAACANYIISSVRVPYRAIMVILMSKGTISREVSLYYHCRYPCGRHLVVRCRRSAC